MDGRDDLKDQRTELAAERSELAVDRSALANERTYSAWMRTGLGALAAGLAVIRLMEDLSLPAWTPKAVGLGLIVYAIFCFLAGAWRYKRTRDAFHRATVRPVSMAVLFAATGILVAAALVAVVGITLADGGATAAG